MSVFENMAFGLRLAKAPRQQIEADVRAAARILNIEELRERKPRALSGGQRQRVAIGRAIVRKPKVFLFDEPLCAVAAESVKVEFLNSGKVLGQWSKALRWYSRARPS
jgi:ABC-type sugar transport system ATPase subunit